MDFDVVCFDGFANCLADELGFYLFFDVLGITRGNQGSGCLARTVAGQAGLFLKFLGNGVPFRADPVRRKVDFQGHDTILLIIQSDIHDEPASKAESCEVGNRCLKENAVAETLTSPRVIR